MFGRMAHQVREESVKVPAELYCVCPDVTVSCDSCDRGTLEVIRYPCLVAEVLSPTTEARDRGQKSLQYRACPSIQEYLLISSEFPPRRDLQTRETGVLVALHCRSR